MKDKFKKKRKNKMVGKKSKNVEVKNYGDCQHD